MTYRIAYIVGSLSASSVNRILSQALISVAPADLEFFEIGIGDLPLYNRDLDGDYPPEAVALKESLASAHAVLFVTPEYNRSIPGALKNAIDWASRPWGHNSFVNMPVAVIGTSPGQLGTALAQHSLRAVLSFLNTRQLTSPEAYVSFRADDYNADGTVANSHTRDFLSNFMAEFRDHVERVLTVLPRH
ncbi:MAG TPA: NADPH-dependent FMN reductase [Micropruina sp.]|nr:NAD(P)H-dependent oxidoreductase [Propionibacterium sp.]HMQ38471.1 NADPH-dependent FMN reductase [Micropruina sp.]HMR22920.1 NADPH-dependent FMN reductase [Micropruina sp.]